MFWQYIMHLALIVTVLDLKRSFIIYICSCESNPFTCSLLLKISIWYGTRFLNRQFSNRNLVESCMRANDDDVDVGYFLVQTCGQYLFSWADGILFYRGMYIRGRANRKLAMNWIDMQCILLYLKLGFHAFFFYFDWLSKHDCRTHFFLINADGV